ncbi:hypothetical protein CRE_23191 [Caenorhabditis remanei]|uniref:Sdz-33 F-box domain-containing protein n=1 Tax=Caenorhabditis remanei TaxID=31234 RepID=E3NLC9_CAERE|nr:hypothetical protein CRE_23191 [Caenorhabditis remanei]
MLLDRQVEFERISIRHNGSEDEKLLFNQISSNLGLVEDLRIYSVGNPGFSPVFTSWPQNISILSSAWFTLEYLLACTCTTITIWNSLLGNKDFEEILKNWKAGGFSNLEYLYVESQNITNNGELILGMNLMELARTVIQTDDGSKNGTIRLDTGSIEMTDESKHVFSVNSFKLHWSDPPAFKKPQIKRFLIKILLQPITRDWKR